MNSILLEVCVDSTQSIIEASNGGADRFELCSALAVGGLTPSLGLAKFAIKQTRIPAYALIRPRAGDFVFTDHDVDQMVVDIEQLKSVGVNGFVIGALTKEFSLDIPAITRLINAAKPCDITFHRAFDLVTNPFESAEQLIELGIKRILTSGQQSTAIEGIDLIKTLIECFEDKISWMAGSGITPKNVTPLKHIGLTEVHASCKVNKPAYTKQTTATMGGNADFDSFIPTTNSEQVRELKRALNS